MATIGRGSSSGKEKKGTSPSSSLLRKPSSKQPTSTPASSSSSPTNEKTASPTDGKPVPNYLKPTMSSSLDFSRAPKKSPLEPTPVARRRSFDRPPPTSQVQKAIRNGPQTRETKTLRSSSFSHKPTTSSTSVRPASEKIYARTTSAINKEGKITEPIMSKSRSVIRRSTLSSPVTPVTKNKAPSSSAKKGPKSVTSDTSSIDQDTQSVDLLVIEDDLVSLDNEVQSLPEISEMPDCNEELGDPTITDTDTDVEVKAIEDVQENLAVSPGKAIEQQNVHEEKSLDAVNERVTNESGTVEHKQEVDYNEQAVKETVANESDTVNHKLDEKDEIQILEIQPEPGNVQESVEDEKKPADEQKIPAEELKLLAEEPKTTAEEPKVIAEEPKTIAEEPKVTPNVEECVKEEQNVKLVEEKKEEGAQKLEAVKVEEVPKANEETQTVSPPAKEKEEKQTVSPPAKEKQTVSPPAKEKQTVSPPAKEKEDKQTISPPAKEKEDKQPVSAPARAGQMSSGKKDKQDYNNIIEQTSTKLMGSTTGRRNKVLALAGAFETVISLDKK